jgi:hypothetical protein
MDLEAAGKSDFAKATTDKAVVPGGEGHSNFETGCG